MLGQIPRLVYMNNKLVQDITDTFARYDKQMQERAEMKAEIARLKAENHNLKGLVTANMPVAVEIAEVEISIP